jgi:hypothetical protein
MTSDSMVRLLGKACALCVTVLAMISVDVHLAASASSPRSQQPDRNASAIPAVSSIKWGDGSNNSLSLDWATIVAGTAKVVLINSADTEQSIAIQLREVSDVRGNYVTPRLTALPKQMQLSAHGIGEVQVALADVGNQEEPASYNGQLIAIDQKAVAIPLRLAIVASTPQSGVAKLVTLTMAPVNFRALWAVAIEVPLLNKIPPANKPPNGSLVGYLHSDSGEYVAVRLTNIARNAPDSGKEKSPAGASPSPLVAQLSIDAMRHGHFEGDVYFSGGTDRKAAVSLIVEGRDHWIWPTLVITLGIVLAALSKMYVGTFRTLWILRRQEADLGRLIKDATLSFSGSASTSRYSPLADFERQRADFRSSLDSFQSWERSIQDNRTFFSDRLQRLSTLQNQISDWAALGHDLMALAQQIDQTLGEIGASDKSSEAVDCPSGLARAKDLYVGCPVAGVELGDIRAKVKAEATFLADWRKSGEELRLVVTRLDQVVPGEKKDGLSQAIEKARIDLWSATSDSDLSEAEKEIAGIAAEMATWLGSKSPDIRELTTIVGEEQTVADSTHDAVPDAVPLDKERKRFFGWLIEAGDGATFTIGAGLAVLTALNTYYIDKPFGTLHDYLSLFLTAAGTKAAVDVVAALVDRFGGVTSSAGAS